MKKKDGKYPWVFRKKDKKDEKGRDNDIEEVYAGPEFFEKLEDPIEEPAEEAPEVPAVEDPDTVPEVAEPEPEPRPSVFRRHRPKREEAMCVYAGPEYFDQLGPDEDSTKPEADEKSDDSEVEPAEEDPEGEPAEEDPEGTASEDPDTVTEEAELDPELPPPPAFDRPPFDPQLTMCVYAGPEYFAPPRPNIEFVGTPPGCVRMYYCPKCGYPCKKEDRFCRECGTPQNNGGDGDGGSALI